MNESTGWTRLAAAVPSGSKIFTVDALLRGQEIWIVPHWLEAQAGQWRTPGVAIRIDQLEHQLHIGQQHDLTLNEPMPTSVLMGHAQPSEGARFEVIRGPSDHFGWIAAPSRN